MNSRVENYIVEMLGAMPSSSNLEEYVADCPNCGKENHFGFNVARHVGHCFVCGYSVNLLRLIEDIEGCNYLEAIIRAAKLKTQHVQKPAGTKLGDALRERLAGKAPLAKTELTLPRFAIPISAPDAAPAREYLQSRGVTSQLYTPFNLLYVVRRDDDAPQFWRHIVFPIYGPDGALRYWTTRAAQDVKGMPKSYHAASTKSGVLLGMDVVRSRCCALVEGPFDAMAAYPLGVAALGRVLTVEQCVTLRERYAEVIVCFDADAGAETIRACRALRRSGIENIFTAALPDAVDDPADFLSALPGRSLAAYLLRVKVRAGGVMRIC